MLTSQHLLDQGRPGVDQGLHMGTHRHDPPRHRTVFNFDLVHVRLQLLSLNVLDLLPDGVMNQFPFKIFKLLHHHRKNQSQPSPRLKNLEDGNLTTNSIGQTILPLKNQLHKQLPNALKDHIPPELVKNFVRARSVYLDSVRIPNDSWTTRVCGHSNTPNVSKLPTTWKNGRGPA